MTSMTIMVLLCHDALCILATESMYDMQLLCSADMLLRKSVLASAVQSCDVLLRTHVTV